MMSQCVRASDEKYLPFPRFLDNDDEAFDGIVSAEERLVVMEYKGGFLSAYAKYAEDEDEFIRDLGRKFGGQKGAGIEQLARKVAAIFAEDPARRRRINGLDISSVRVVIPVLVVQDSFASSEVTASYLADVFGALMSNERLAPKVACAFPIVLDVSDVEAVRPFLTAGVSFADCLLERANLGSGVLSFRDFFEHYRTSRNISFVPDNETMDRFTQIMDRLSIRFFKKPLQAA